MECGRLINGLRWSAYYIDRSPTDSDPMSLSIEACDEPSAVSDNYLITHPGDDCACVYNEEPLRGSFTTPSQLNRYSNSLSIPTRAGTSDDGDVDELTKDEAKKFEDYKFCEAVNDFDIELETGEAVPIVYLPTTRVARLQRALRLSGLKKDMNWSRSLY